MNRIFLKKILATRCDLVRKNMRIYIHSLCILAFLLQGCAHREAPPNNLELDVKSSALGKEPLASSQDAQDSLDLELFNDHTYQMGSCKDDVFAKWLIDAYKITNPFTGKSKSAREAWEKKAQTFAMSRLSMANSAPEVGSLPLVDVPEVDRWIRHFKASDRSTFLQWLSLGKGLEPLILPELEKVGVPKEFYYLAMIESGFNLKAKSRAAASGAWQFMSRTAMHYGLRIDKYVDERKDPVKSSRAAAALIKDLYSKFGDWYLAMAAYNAGPQRVANAIKLAKSRDFWTLARGKFLPKETIEYVPRWIAAYKIGSKPALYGFQISPNIESVMPTGAIHFTKPYSISELATNLSVPEKELLRWNPEILRGITPPIRTLGGNYQLRIKEELIPILNEKLPKIAFLDIRDTFEYRIKPGDTLRSIAKKHGVSLSEILKINPSLKPTALRIGRGLLVPAG